MTEPRDPADRHPEVQRLRQDPAYLTDPLHHMTAEFMRQFLSATYRALHAERVPSEQVERIVNRIVYGSPTVPLDRLRMVDPAVFAPRLRTGGLDEKGKPRDGLGPLQPGDAIAEHVPVRFVERTGTPEGKATLAHARDMIEMATTPEKQWAWLASGGEARADDRREGRAPSLTDATQSVIYTEAFGGGYSWSCSCGGRSKRYAVISTEAAAVRGAERHHKRRHPEQPASPVRVPSRRRDRPADSGEH